MIRRLLFACAAVSLMAQAPVIHFDTFHHDFGRITPDRKVSTKFHVTNTGNAILSITQVRPSCGCTATVLGKWSIGPGESTDLETTFDPHGQRGTVRKSMEVVCNDPKTPQVTLTFEANVVQEIMPSVDALYLVAARSVPAHASVRYSPGDGEPVKITEARAPGAGFLAFSWHPEGKDAVLDVTFDGRQVPKGQFRGVETATVRFTNPRLPQLPLDVQWELKPYIQANPSTLVFEGTAGTDLHTRLVLKQADGKPFRVTAMSCSMPQLRVQGLMQAAAPQQVLDIVLPASVKPGRYSETLALTTSDPDQPELTLRIAAILK
ncbi:MAG TPA: DUF1573 domain-containing protein [Holophagaceae bacterium]